MQDDPLIKYCNNKPRIPFRIIPDPYWTTTVYSLGKHLREYGYYPSWLPLCVYSDHGLRSSYTPFKHELESDAPTQLCHSPTTKHEWEKHSSKPCYVMTSPFVCYRRKNHIRKSESAVGTISFPAHSTPSIDDVSDVELYIKQLLELPEEFKPVSVCLHMHDINKGQHHFFEKYNIPVLTAGNTFDERFAERFYEIIKKFRYATSNMVGSYLYYCVEMGIPFSIYGNKQIFINRKDPNITKGLYDPYKEFERFKYVYDLFSGLNTSISSEQKDYVEGSLGLKGGLSRSRMSIVLYTSLFKWLISGIGIKYIFKYIFELNKRVLTKIKRMACQL
jgi:hypothetical protein